LRFRSVGGKWVNSQFYAYSVSEFSNESAGESAIACSKASAVLRQPGDLRLFKV